MKYCLATVGISETWDFDSKLFILGAWCLTNERNKALLKNRDYLFRNIDAAKKIDNFYRRVSRKEAEDYCYKIYKEILPQLSENLNSIHEVSYPERYWQVLIGPWLFFFIQILYERYKRIENAFDLFPNLYTYVLPMEQCRLRTYDTNELMAVKVNDDYYNLKLFSLIAYTLCPQNAIEKKVHEDEKSKLKPMPPNNKYTFKRVARYMLKLMCNRLLDFSSQNSIILSDMYHLTHGDMFLLKYKIGFRKISFKNFYSIRVTSLENTYSHNHRDTMKLKVASDKFQSLLYSVITDAIPMCYIENYKSYKDNIKNMNPVRIIGSATGWYYNEGFKFFAAESVSKNAKHIEFQHGGAYGLLLKHSMETLSFEKDIFCTWGWKSNKSNKTIPLSSPHLSKSKDTYSSKLDNILFVGTGYPRYCYLFHTQLLPDNMTKYIEDKKTFLCALRNRIKNNILYRPYPIDYGWGEVEVIKEICPASKVIFDCNLVDWMKKVKLVVIDHPLTSFIEAMSINVPSIFFWDHEVYLMRPNVEKYFELLRKAGILHKSPEDAAKKVNEIWHDPISWWYQPEVQESKNEFCRQFALTSKSWHKEWGEFLKNIQDC